MNSLTEISICWCDQDWTIPLGQSPPMGIIPVRQSEPQASFELSWVGTVRGKLSRVYRWELFQGSCTGGTVQVNTVGMEGGTIVWEPSMTLAMEFVKCTPEILVGILKSL